MKKQLLAGTAIAAASVLIAGGAAAQDKKMMKPSISVNGYYTAHLSGVVDDDINSGQVLNPPAVDLRSDSEVHFNGSAKLDNGLSIKVRWELEGNSHTSAGKPSPANGNDQIDEVYITVSGSFGSVIVGSTDNAAVKMLTRMTGAWATNVGQNFHFNSQEWVRSAVGTGGGRFHVLHDARIREHGGGGDSEKVSYLSPKFSGFQIGASYTPYADQDFHVNHDVDAGRHDGFTGAVSYSGKFDGVGLSLGAGVNAMQGADGQEDLNEWVVAGSFDFGGGFRVAAAHQRTTSGISTDPSAIDLEGYVTEGGVRYTQGANAFSLVGSYGEFANTDDMYSAVKASYRRTLGPGVFLDANLWMNRSENAAGAENSGTAFSTGITVLF
ncbi:MAG: porin [Defluviicoccus sp.]|nr:porin [Defluviicoccus sp.]MDE0383197.1 porin [Defluviicoccus sp.]